MNTCSLRLRQHHGARARRAASTRSTSRARWPRRSRAAHGSGRGQRADGRLGFLDLPHATETVDQVKELAEGFGQWFEDVVVLGIGGSGLGAEGAAGRAARAVLERALRRGARPLPPAARRRQSRSLHHERAPRAHRSGAHALQRDQQVGRDRRDDGSVPHRPGRASRPPWATRRPVGTSSSRRIRRRARSAGSARRRRSRCCPSRRTWAADSRCCRPWGSCPPRSAASTWTRCSPERRPWRSAAGAPTSSRTRRACSPRCCTTRTRSRDGRSTC